MPNDAMSLFLSEIVEGYRAQKTMAERAMEQLEPHEWHATIDPESNPVSVLVRHLAGNLRSRWRDFLTTDGDKPDRDRDGEFETTSMSPEALMAEWEEGFAVALASLEALTPEDLTRTITIRGQPHGVVRAILRNYDHTAHHIGQIVMLAKHWRGDRWRTLSIPKKRDG